MRKNESHVYRYSLTVSREDLDELDHVNNLVYLKWCLKSAGSHSRAVGWPAQKYRDSGFGFVIRGHQIKYKIPALLGDQVIVKTWVASMDRVSSRRKYHILRAADGKRLVEAETTWVFVDLNDMKLAKIPEDVRQAFMNWTPERT